MKVENAAHWVNEQLKLCPADEQVRFAGRSTGKYSVRRRLHDVSVYDDRYMVTLYTWRRGLPVTLRDGHVIRRNLHAYSPKKRAPNYPRRIPKRGDSPVNDAQIGINTALKSLANNQISAK